MPIIPGSNGGSGGGEAFPLNYAVSQEVFFQQGQEREIISSSENLHLRKYWIYNAGKTIVFLRIRSSSSSDFVDFPLLPGYMFEGVDKSGSASGWYAFSEESSGILNIHIKSDSPIETPVIIDQSWVELTTASWQPTGLGEEAMFFARYTGDNSHIIPATVQVNASERTVFLASSNLGSSFSDAIENNGDYTSEQLYLSPGEQGTYQWNYNEYPFLIAFDIIGAYDDVLLHEMSLDMSLGFPVISLSRSISIY